MDGYTVKEIPLKYEDAVAITAVKVCGDKVYFGLTGGDAILIELDPASDSIRDTGFRFPSKGNKILNKIHNSLAKGPDDLFYIGHGSNINMNKWEFPPVFDGGHLYSYDPRSGATEDLGLAAARSTVHALEIGDGFLFGYTIPDNHLFAHDLQLGELTDLGNISGSYSNHNFACAGKKAFGAYARAQQSSQDKLLVEGTYLFVYDHEERTYEPTEQIIAPAKLVMDSWVAASDRIYGGRGDGVLIELDPETREVREIGIARPNGGTRITGLAEHDGKIFGTAGFPVMGLFSYEPASGEFRDYGKVTEEYPRICYFHGIDILPDGRVYVGETDSNRPNAYVLEPV